MSVALVSVSSVYLCDLSLGERVGPHLEVHYFTRSSLAGLHVKWRAGADRRVEPAPFPARFRIVDAAVHPFRVETDRIGNAEHDPLAVLEDEQSFRRVARVDRNVLAEAERVVPVDPRVVARFGA